MDRPRILRLLRIAFSAGCGIGCLLLIALWVRSYWRWDNLYLELSTSKATFVGTCQGTMQFSLTHFRTDQPVAWMHRSMPIAEFLVKMKSSSVTENFGLARLTYRWPQEWLVRVRIWLAVLLSGTLATLAWIHWSKRFSLRTLLIVTTLLAMLLGAVVYAVK